MGKCEYIPINLARWNLMIENSFAYNMVARWLKKNKVTLLSMKMF